ncbi:MAG: dipeptide epimerase [Xanthomonadales bacterium]|nr:dipeptide epimerase [Gammaproteobacteria bacterium]NND56299.1 dipeptide epimerase [Xanthomonadales bacterium]NNK51394.1 dipeptide epimerase [Xanthomonadales bacterium]
MQFSAHLEDWELAQPFRIAGKEWLTSPTLVVQLAEGGHVGRGEAQGVFYLDETAQSIFEQVHAVANEVRQGITRTELQQLLPAGGARNAIDCALWDLECKQSGRTIWQLTGIDPKPVTTVFTIGLESTPEAMAAKAAAAADAPILKIKLDGHQPYEKLAAIRAARPDAALVVDANQGWDFDLLQEVIPRCASLDLGMIEQPLPRGGDEMLEGFDSPVTLAADESCLDSSELEVAARRYGMINIKLDKTGGLTEALKLAREAKALGCKLMVGNMVGTSLGMAPSFVVAQLCDFVDIDGPLLLRYDHPMGLSYNRGVVGVFSSRFWG